MANPTTAVQSIYKYTHIDKSVADLAVIDAAVVGGIAREIYVETVYAY